MPDLLPQRCVALAVLAIIVELLPGERGDLLDVSARPALAACGSHRQSRCGAFVHRKLGIPGGGALDLAVMTRGFG